jgi:putative ABC transport system permease protein
MPASFDFPMATELWTPHALTPGDRANRRSNQLEAAARLRPQQTLEQAGAEIDRISASLEKSYPDTNKGRHYMVWPARRFIVDSYTQQYLIMLLGSVTCSSRVPRAACAKWPCAPPWAHPAGA